MDADAAWLKLLGFAARRWAEHAGLDLDDALVELVFVARQGGC